MTRTEKVARSEFGGVRTSCWLMSDSPVDAVAKVLVVEKKVGVHETILWPR